MAPSIRDHPGGPTDHECAQRQIPACHLQRVYDMIENKT